MYRRHLLGVVALLLFATAGWLAWKGPAAQFESMVLASSLRIGAVLAVIWLAWPDLAKLSPFFLIACGAAIVVMLRWPQAMVYLLPVLALFWLLRPRHARSRRGNVPSKKQEGTALRRAQDQADEPGTAGPQPSREDGAADAHR
jgi:hypothetical protein